MTVKQFWHGLVAILAVVVLMMLLLLAQYGWHTVTLNAIFSSLVAVILALLAGVVLAMMLNGTINLSLLISEDNGNASLSRFQFLIFTFVIAMSYFLFVLATLAHMSGSQTAATAADASGNFQLPEIPTGVLGLIGLSGGSYVIAKGIQKSSETDQGLKVAKIQISDGGNGYAVGHVPVTITDGGGTNATAFASVEVAGGPIKEIIITSPGSGYVTPPDVKIDSPPVGTGNRPATAKAVLG